MAGVTRSASSLLILMCSVFIAVAMLCLLASLCVSVCLHCVCVSECMCVLAVCVCVCVSTYVCMFSFIVFFKGSL